MSYLRRLASYRTLPDSDNMVFCTMLANLGYTYTGYAYDIVCDACGVKAQIHKDWQITRSILRHESGCVFESSLGDGGEFESLGAESSSSRGGSDLCEADAPSDDPLESVRTTATYSELPVYVIEPTNGFDDMVPSFSNIEPTFNNVLAPFSATQQHNDDQQSGYNENYVNQKSPSASSNSSGYVSDITIEDNGSKKDNRNSDDQDFQRHGNLLPSTKKNVQEVEIFNFQDLFQHESLSLKSSKDLRHCTLSGRECDKNPGHYAYFNTVTLNPEQIPTQFRCTEMLNVLKIMSDLTVRIVVSTTSGNRRNGNQHKVRVGTGFVIEHLVEFKQSTQNGEKSKFKSIKKFMSKLKKKNVDLVFIQTSRHLVYNDEEAQNTVVEFFHDGPERKDIVSLEGKYLLNSTTPGDSQCLLVCECSDSAFAQRLNLLQCEFFALSERLSLKAKKGMSKKLFMIHHPHGGPKVVSYGDYVTVKYKYESKGDLRQPRLTKLKGSVQVGPDVSVYRKTLFYAADTCPGSCGAPILTFCPRQSEANGDMKFKIDIWIHYGVETSHKLGASVLKECLIEDFLQPRPDALMAHPEEDSDDEDSLGKQKVNSLVYKVISTPSHAEYTLYQRRLDSFRNWEFSHILRPEYLASSGFYYTDVSDCVRCFQCGLGLRSWKQGDDVITEHEKYRPTCPYLKSLPRGQEDNITGAVASLEAGRDVSEHLEVKLLKAENTIMKKQLTCKVCFKSDIKDVFLPCGELYACSECSKLLTHCPSCKKPILATVTVYLT